MNLLQSLHYPALYSFTSIMSFLFFAFSCDKSPVSPISSPTIDREDGKSLQQTSQDLYSACLKDHVKENFVISPLSIQWALLMAYNGAEGSTKAEMEDLLHLNNMDLKSVNERSENLLRYFSDLLKEGHLDIHNGLFYDNTRVNLNADYVHRLKQYFQLTPKALDFNQTESVESINGWVRDKTYQKIDKVLDEISENDLLFLINALYLKADWVYGFSVDETRDRPFMTAEGREIEIPTMSRTGVVEYSNTSGQQIIRMPLADSALYAYFIMPSDPATLSQVIDLELIESIWQNNLDFMEQRLALQLPVIETKTHLSLISPLNSLGMKTAFESQKANFRGMGSAASGQPLFITKAFHDTYLKMDEKGVEGAAVTTIGVGVTSVPESVAFNKPFMYLIVDQNLGLPLFIGQFTGIEINK